MGAPPGVSVWPSYWSMRHWNPIVNGYSGVIPPSYYLLPDLMTSFPSTETITLLQGVGVTTILVNTGAYTPAEWLALRERISATPELTPVREDDVALYALAPDPWLWRLASAVPQGEPVTLHNVSADPVTFGMLMAILQRNGHHLDGSGQIHYLTLDPPASPQCHAVLSNADDPAVIGYARATVVRRERNLTLYRHPTCPAPG
jgi:hypothetical protein